MRATEGATAELSSFQGPNDTICAMLPLDGSDDGLLCTRFGAAQREKCCSATEMVSMASVDLSCGHRPRVMSWCTRRMAYKAQLRRARAVSTA